MKLTSISLVAAAILTIAACHTSKKSTTSTTPTTNTTTQPVVMGPAKSTDGIYEPGNDELVAIQAEYKDVTLDKLKQGYNIYVGITCTRCHGTKNIYKRDKEKWGFIVDDMAGRAKLNGDEKDALLKYVFAIKDTQPK